MTLSAPVTKFGLLSQLKLGIATAQMLRVTDKKTYVFNCAITLNTTPIQYTPKTNTRPSSIKLTTSSCTKNSNITPICYCESIYTKMVKIASEKVVVRVCIKCQ